MIHYPRTIAAVTTSNTLAQLQSDIKNETTENNREETDAEDVQDQSEEIEDSNGQEDEKKYIFLFCNRSS